MNGCWIRLFHIWNNSGGNIVLFSNNSFIDFFSFWRSSHWRPRNYQCMWQFFALYSSILSKPAFLWGPQTWSCSGLSTVVDTGGGALDEFLVDLDLHPNLEFCPSHSLWEKANRSGDILSFWKPVWLLEGSLRALMFSLILGTDPSGNLANGTSSDEGSILERGSSTFGFFWGMWSSRFATFCFSLDWGGVMFEN
jgi:hypothetical protein